MSDLELKKQLSSSDIICPECIKNDDPDLLAENATNAEDNEPPKNTKIIYISKTPHEHALHILKEHPECERVAWANAQIAHEKEQEAKRIEDAKPKNSPLGKALSEVLTTPEPTPIVKPPKENIFKRLMRYFKSLKVLPIKKDKVVKPIVHRKKKISL